MPAPNTEADASKPALSARLHSQRVVGEMQVITLCAYMPARVRRNEERMRPEAVPPEWSLGQG